MPPFFFAWLCMAVNLLHGGVYLMTSPLMGFGDWKGFLAHVGWLIAGGVAMLVCIFVLEPSIPLSR